MNVWRSIIQKLLLTNQQQVQQITQIFHHKNAKKTQNMYTANITATFESPLQTNRF